MMNQNTTIKRLFILSAVLAVIIVVAVGVMSYVRSFKDVSFAVSNPNNDTFTLKIYPSDEQEQPKHTLSSSGTANLRTGEYIAVMSGNGIEPTTKNFSVTDDTTIAISVVYTSEKLASLLKEESLEIRQAIYERYPQLSPNKQAWTFIDEKLHHQGQWYSATFRPRGNKFSDVYRIIAEKKSGQWVAATRAYILLSTSEYPNIPRDILVDVNTRQKTQLREM